MRSGTVAEVGCAKVANASANIETVFSGAGRISAKSRTLSPIILSQYAFCHYNDKYEWLRPSVEEIVAAYMKLFTARRRETPMRRATRATRKGEEKGEEEEEEEEEGEEE